MIRTIGPRITNDAAFLTTVPQMPVSTRIQQITSNQQGVAETQISK